MVLQNSAGRNNPTLRIQKIFRERKNIYVVRIGSNNGITYDPRHELLWVHPSWEALLGEPVPYFFERLQNNYPKDSHFHFENAAISEKLGTLRFYHLDKGAKDRYHGLPSWHDQIGSFDPSHIRRHFGNDLDIK